MVIAPAVTSLVTKMPSPSKMSASAYMPRYIRATSPTCVFCRAMQRTSQDATSSLKLTSSSPAYHFVCAPSRPLSRSPHLILDARLKGGIRYLLSLASICSCSSPSATVDKRSRLLGDNSGSWKLVGIVAVIRAAVRTVVHGTL